MIVDFRQKQGLEVFKKQLNDSPVPLKLGSFSCSKEVMTLRCEKHWGVATPKYFQHKGSLTPKCFQHKGSLTPKCF